MNVPWLSKKTISDAAADLIGLYESKTGLSAPPPPTPVEAIIEKGLGLSIGFGDINTEFGSCLLMPESLVRQSFKSLYGAEPLKIYNFESAYCGPLGFDPCVANWPLMAEAAIHISRFTNVSRQAMIIRLQQLELVQNLSGVQMSWASLKA